MPEAQSFLEVAKSICQYENFNLIKELGGGTYKKVYSIKTNNYEKFALKIIKSSSSSERLLREIKAIEICNHPNIAKLIKIGSHKFSNTTYNYILEELLEGGKLTDRLDDTNFTSSKSKCYEIGVKLISAITHISSHGLVHRDIKPDNILFRDSGISPVLVDFGIVRNLLEESLTLTWLQLGPCAPYFASPEQLNNQKALIDWRSDQFSLGVVLSFTFFGYHPYQIPEDTVYSQNTVERVATRKIRNKLIMDRYMDSGFYCLEKMTRAWPVERYRVPQELINDWKIKRGI